jgi:hypothetical protein
MGRHVTLTRTHVQGRFGTGKLAGLRVTKFDRGVARRNAPAVDRVFDLDPPSGTSRPDFPFCARSAHRSDPRASAARFEFGTIRPDRPKDLP